MDRVNLHCARWLFPVASPLIQDGAVVIQSGVIIDFGHRDRILAEYRGNLQDHGQGAILPALANTHVHLELSALRGRISPEVAFVDWLRNVIRLRNALSKNEIIEGIKDSLKEMADSGTLLIADVTNSGLSVPILGKSFFKGQIFLELLGFNRERCSQAFFQGKVQFDSLNAIKPQNFDLALCPHAIYSVHESLFMAIKEHNNSLNQVSTVHLAESREESCFLNNTESALKRFLQERAVWEEGWHPPFKSPVSFLDDLGFLDEKTICAHLTQANESDINLLSSKKVRVSICPRSNLKLGVGLPPLPRFLNSKLLVSIGTDSLASNDDLNIFGEMLVLRRHFPQIPGELILEMATLNGAKTLNLSKDYGSIEKGKKVPLLLVNLTPYDQESVLDSVIQAGYLKRITWLFE